MTKTWKLLQNCISFQHEEFFKLDSSKMTIILCRGCGKLKETTIKDFSLYFLNMKFEKFFCPHPVLFINDMNKKQLWSNLYLTSNFNFWRNEYFFDKGPSMNQTKRIDTTTSAEAIHTITELCHQSSLSEPT